MAVNKTRTPIGEQNPEERVRNFGEVCLGYTEEEGRMEAARCLQCGDAPCIGGCPVAIDIPAFILAVKDGDMRRAADIMSRYTNLPAVCGRVCPQETQCEGVCRLGRAKGFEPVAIGKLERLVADWNYSQPAAPKISETAGSGKIGRVAVVGSGPAGLTAAGDLVKMGYDVTVFEALHAPGGVLMYGIPEFRLPKSIVEKEIKAITDLGVKFVPNAIIGRTITISEVESGFDACFIGIGAGAPHFQGIPGTTLNGVSSASEYLTRINLMHGYKFPHYNTPVKKSKKVVVIGGGNVAMDAARSAMRLGADAVSIIYRRSEAELPARVEEYHHALDERISFHWLSNPTEYVDDGSGSLKGVTCVKMALGEADASGRGRPIPIPGSEFFMEADTAIEAIGQEANKILLSSCPGLKLNKRGYIETDPETGESSIPWIFAGGDIVTGAATVILAMGAGKASAAAIDRYVRSRKAQA